MKLIDLFESSSKNEHDAVTDYLRDSGWFNAPLRGRGLENSYEKHITKVKLLDDAIQKAEPLKSPLTCYRAIPKHVIEDLKVGDIY